MKELLAASWLVPGSPPVVRPHCSRDDWLWTSGTKLCRRAVTMGLDAEVEELKECVMQTLESKGVLSQIRAQLRSCVFTAVQERPSASPPSSAQPPLSGSAALAQELVLEYLAFHSMKYTRDVFSCEAKATSPDVDREQLCDRVGITVDGGAPRWPVLEQLICGFQEQASTAVNHVHAAGTAGAATLASADAAFELSSLDSMGESSADDEAHKLPKVAPPAKQHLAGMPALPGASSSTPPTTATPRGAADADAIPVRAACLLRASAGWPSPFSDSSEYADTDGLRLCGRSTGGRAGGGIDGRRHNPARSGLPWAVLEFVGGVIPKLRGRVLRYVPIGDSF
jgi:hypothetical protein